MFLNSIARREISDSWEWMRTIDNDAAVAAEQWVTEHKEEMKQLDRVLYDSENKYYNKFGFNDLEDEFGNSCATVDFIDTIPQDVLDRLYNDTCWFDMSKYMPSDSEEADSMLQFDAIIVEGLRELTEMQREVLFRNVINQESTASIAASKKCSARNICAIRARALSHLRKKTGIDKSGSTTISALWHITIALFIASLIVQFLLQPLLDLLPNWSMCILAPTSLIVAYMLYRKLQMQNIKDALRSLWQSNKGESKDK